MTIVFVCGDPVVSASILPYLSATHRSHSWRDDMGCAYNVCSPLVLIRGTMTAQRYVHDILQPDVLPLMQRLPGAIFQQDNGRSHTAKVLKDCLCTVTTLSWPVRSPDLSPIEHTGIIWDGELGLPRVCTNSRQGYNKYGTKCLKTSFRTCML
ncbi:transposable element Tcb2 transposase [Trichonephila clavipes]|nr:transposable element Tcb2 transposase [Trichonephila clavipes]